DKDGAVEAVLISRPLDTFRSETWRVEDGRVFRLNLPERVSVFGARDGELVFSNDEAWALAGTEFVPGSLLAVPLNEVAADAPVSRLTLDPIAFSPGARESLQDVRVMSDGLFFTYSDNVVGRLVHIRRERMGDEPVWRAS